MKKILSVILCCLCCLSLFAESEKATLVKVDILDDFGDPTGKSYIAYNQDLTGTFSNSNSKGNLLWNIQVDPTSGKMFFILKENGQDKDVTTSSSSTYYVDSSAKYTITFKLPDGSTQSVSGSLIKSETYKMNNIQPSPSLFGYSYDWSCFDLFMSNSSLKVVIKSDYGSYSLGNMDLTGFEGVIYDKTLYNKGVQLMEQGKYEAALEAFTELKENYLSAYEHYNADEKVTECSKKLGTYAIGMTGPAGGYIFYDCDADNNSGNADGLISSECGWRYLEAAPTDLSYEGVNYGSQYVGYKYVFGYYRTNDSDSNCGVGTSEALGSGMANTQALVLAMGTTTYDEQNGESKEIYAAKGCADYSITKDGIVYDDWFLPSSDELNLIYTNLISYGMGNFEQYSNYYGGAMHYYDYWSSSEFGEDGSNALAQLFDSGRRGYDARSAYYRVRPIRAFSMCSDGSVNHVWDSGVETTPATCISGGIKTYTCTTCGQTKTEYIALIAHTSDSGKITKQPTCTAEGTKTYSCTVCGQAIKTESIPITHTYVNYRCINCGIWEKGPSGGYVFYDCDADNDSGNADGLISSECGWRFLEAAPEDLSSKYSFGYYRTRSSGSKLTVGTKTAIGTGKANTEALVKAMGETTYTDTSERKKGIYAAKGCSDYSVTADGVVYDDWFLPSKDELNLMYVNLHKQGLGSFASSFYSDYAYWSSSEYSGYDAWLQYFYYGDQYYEGYRGSDYYVRPIRAF